MAIYVGETASETFATGVAGETFTRVASYIDGTAVTWNPTFTDLTGGSYRYSYVTTTVGPHEWVGTGSATGLVFINFDVDAVTSAPTVTFETGSWTYGADFTTQRDRVRRLIPDVKVSNQLLTDTEVALFCTGGALEQADDYLAAAMCCETIADSLMVDISAGGTSVSLSQQFDHWMARAEKLRDLSGTIAVSSSAPYAGGISIADVVAREADTDRVVPFFARETATLTDPARWGR